MQGGSSGIVYGGLKYQASKQQQQRLLEPSRTTCLNLFLLSLLLQAQCIADVRADAGSNTGTLSLKEENEVRVSRP